MHAEGAPSEEEWTGCKPTIRAGALDPVQACAVAASPTTVLLYCPAGGLSHRPRARVRKRALCKDAKRRNATELSRAGVLVRPLLNMPSMAPAWGGRGRAPPPRCVAYEACEARPDDRPSPRIPTDGLGGVLGGEDGAEAAVLPVGLLLTAIAAAQLANPRVRERLLELDRGRPMRWHPRPTVAGSAGLLVIGLGVIGVSLVGLVRLFT